ncbi:transposase [Streptomyces sp. ITFR-6]|uniref:transposase n=1 Tax=Streptomyces sp. ITFR-6 TaxID=3075197 RepID=UPI0037DA25CE
MGSKYTRRYSDEYKRDAIEVVRSSGRTVTDVFRELGVSSESLRAWVKKALGRGSRAGDGSRAVGRRRPGRGAEAAAEAHRGAGEDD